MKKFKIPLYTGKIKEVEAEPMKISGIDCFIFKENGLYNISHLQTGMCLSKCISTKKDSISVVKKQFKKHPNWLITGMERLKEYGFKYPINT